MASYHWLLKSSGWIWKLFLVCGRALPVRYVEVEDSQSGANTVGADETCGYAGASGLFFRGDTSSWDAESRPGGNTGILFFRAVKILGSSSGWGWQYCRSNPWRCIKAKSEFHDHLCKFLHNFFNIHLACPCIPLTLPHWFRWNLNDVWLSFKEMITF